MTEKTKSTTRADTPEPGKGQTPPEDKAGKTHGTTNSDGGSLGGDREQNTPLTRWPWLAQFALALSVTVVVVVLLVALPTVSMLVVERTSSGLSEGSLAGTVSFWGALFAAFISLVVLFIGAVFAFTAFKVDSGAKWEARKAAEEGVGELIDEKCWKIVSHEAKDFVEKNGTTITGEVAYHYIRETGGEGQPPRGDKITRQAADNYVNENGAGITGEAAVNYVNENGERITGKAADNHVSNNGERIIGKAADNYVSNNGERITGKAADDYVNKNGERITMERADDYIRETGEAGEPSRGEKFVRQGVDDYVKNVVDDYAGEDIEGEEMTRVEKMAREVVETAGADEVARLVDERLASEVTRLVDERLASLGLAGMLRLRFMRRDRRDGPGSPGKDQG